MAWVDMNTLVAADPRTDAAMAGRLNERMLDFDNIDEWAPIFDSALGSLVPDFLVASLLAAAPKYFEDAAIILLSMAGREAVIDATLDLLRSEQVVGYHGSRLTDADVASIRAVGLIPLEAENRRGRLLRTMSRHYRWPEVAGQFEAVLKSYGQGGAAGCREGQACLSLSKSGLVNAYNHYLTHGAEFDQAVAHKLFGAEGVDLLASDGQPRVVRFAVPGDFALEAAHPFFSIEQIRARGDLPGLAGDFLESWSYRFIDREFQTRTLKKDFGLMFRSTVPASWIIGVETLSDSDVPSRG